MVEWKCCEKCRGTKDNPTICMACPEIKIEAEEKLAVLLDELATQRAVNKEMLSVRIKELEEKLAEKDAQIDRLVDDLERPSPPKEADKKPNCLNCPHNNNGLGDICCNNCPNADLREADKPIGIDYPITNHKWGPFTVWFMDDGRGFEVKLCHNSTALYTGWWPKKPKEADKRPDDETCPKCGSTQIVCWKEHTMRCYKCETFFKKPKAAEK